MKNVTLINTVVAILFLSVSRLHAQSFFSVYCKNDYTLKLNSASIDSIVHSKTDINGNERMTYQTKEIWTPDSVYRIALEDIDSVVIIPVEQVAHYIANVTTGMDYLFKNSKTIDELSSHINKIEAIDGVEGVWYDDITLFVDVRGWGVISYMFPPVPEEDDSYMTARSHTISNSAMHNQENLSRVGIVNLFWGDSDYSRANNNANLLYKNFLNCGFSNTTPIYSADLSFFENEMFDYDILFLMTHGGYDQKKGLHYIITSDVIDISSADDPFGKAVALLKFDERFKNADPQKIYLTKIKTSGDENTNFYYVKISELYIKSLRRKFKDNSIVFMTACKAFKKNSNLANAFIEKGAGAVLGYTDTNNMGDAAGYYFYNNMLNGMSVFSAYEALPESVKSKTYISEGKKVSPRLEIVGSKLNTCIVHPETEDYKDLSTSTSLKVVLRGTMTKLDPAKNDVELGVCVTKTKGYYTDRMKAEVKPNSYSVDFELTLDGNYLEPETQYYYSAYLYDGNDYCYGEEKEFKTKSVEKGLCPDNNHPHMIDLGLPSGTKWACCNVGANSPEDSGSYFAWGETEEKTVYDWDTYLYGSYVYPRANVVDIGSDISGTSYDVAHVKWGNSWRMPNKEDYIELLNNTRPYIETDNGVYTMESLNGVKGRIYQGKTGAIIFFPYSGYHNSLTERVLNYGRIGYYWTSSVYKTKQEYAWSFWADESSFSYVEWRSKGHPVRAVVKE